MAFRVSGWGLPASAEIKTVSVAEGCRSPSAPKEGRGARGMQYLVKYVGFCSLTPKPGPNRRTKPTMDQSRGLKCMDMGEQAFQGSPLGLLSYCFVWHGPPKAGKQEFINQTAVEAPAYPKEEGAEDQEWKVVRVESLGLAACMRAGELGSFLIKGILSENCTIRHLLDFCRSWRLMLGFVLMSGLFGPGALQTFDLPTPPPPQS